jgi:hypothetical protein
MLRKVSALVATVLLAGTLATFQARPQDEPCDGRDVRCSDGHYHAPDGTVQPDTCATHEKDSHPCECERAKVCNGGGSNEKQEPGAKCQTYCRKKACSCITPDCS